MTGGGCVVVDAFWVLLVVVVGGFWVLLVVVVGGFWWLLLVVFGYLCRFWVIVKWLEV